MKKLLSIILAAVLSAGLLVGCTSSNEGKNDGKIKVVATIFPEYDWVMNVLGENPGNVEVSLLLDGGVDLHSFQPTVEDIMNISSCDMFIYVGGESDAWVDDCLKQATNKDMKVINLMDVLGDSVKEEEVVEGMQAEEEEEEGEEGEEEIEYDEHVWLSLNNAEILVGAISDNLQILDSANADTYKANAEAYINQLKELDTKYTDAVSNADNKTILFGDRFPFRYLADDYNLTYYAAFVGCSAETEASFETIMFLSGKVDELSLPAVLTIEGENKKIAETIVNSTANKDQKILTMDSMQTTTSNDIKNGVNYLSVMENNLSVLKEALGE